MEKTKELSVEEAQKILSDIFTKSQATWSDKLWMAAKLVVNKEIPKI